MLENLSPVVRFALMALVCLAVMTGFDFALSSLSQVAFTPNWGLNFLLSLLCACGDWYGIRHGLKSI